MKNAEMKGSAVRHTANHVSFDLYLMIRRISMEYMSCPEAAKKWGISERRVQILCRENRIPGVSKLGYMWLIPKDAEKPIDGRTKQGKELHHE